MGNDGMGNVDVGNVDVGNDGEGNDNLEHVPSAQPGGSGVSVAREEGSRYSSAAIGRRSRGRRTVLTGAAVIKDGAGGKRTAAAQDATDGTVAGSCSRWPTHRWLDWLVDTPLLCVYAVQMFRPKLDLHLLLDGIASAPRTNSVGSDTGLSDGNRTGGGAGTALDLANILGIQSIAAVRASFLSGARSRYLPGQGHFFGPGSRARTAWLACLFCLAHAPISWPALVFRHLVSLCELVSTGQMLQVP
jgi:hypothetical protein